MMTKHRVGIVAGVCVGVALGLSGSLFLAPSRSSAQISAAAQNGAPPLAVDSAYGPEEIATMKVFERVAPSVVNIDTTAMQTNLFSMSVTEVPQGSGSGFVYDKKGHIVTNFHVIENAAKVSVTVKGGHRFEAKIVGAEPDKDLALLKIEAPERLLVPVQLADSKALRVGQRVLAIGNPFGLDQTLTTGVVSALEREIQSRTDRRIQDVIQTDAAINPGNSGGPLLDSQGRVIGVNTQIYSPSGASAGIGFAIPANAVSRVVPQLIKYGRVNRPKLGVRLITDAIAKGNGIEGVIIDSVEPGGPADKAGLRGLVQTRSGYPAVGDIIVGVGNKVVKNYSDLLDELDNIKPGDEIKITVERGKGGKKETVTLRTKSN